MPYAFQHGHAIIEMPFMNVLRLRRLGRFYFTDVSRCRQAIIIGQRVVVVRNLQDPDAGVRERSLLEAPIVQGVRNVASCLPIELVNSRPIRAASPPALPAIKHHCNNIIIY